MILDIDLERLQLIQVVLTLVGGISLPIDLFTAALFLLQGSIIYATPKLRITVIGFLVCVFCFKFYILLPLFDNRLVRRLQSQ